MSSQPVFKSLSIYCSLSFIFLPHIFNLFNLVTPPLSLHLTACPALSSYLISVVSPANTIYLIATAWLLSTHFRLVMTSYDHQILRQLQIPQELRFPRDILVASCRLRAIHSTTHEKVYNAVKPLIWAECRVSPRLANSLLRQLTQWTCLRCVHEISNQGDLSLIIASFLHSELHREDLVIVLTLLLGSYLVPLQEFATLC